MLGGQLGGWPTCQVSGWPGTREPGPVHVVRRAQAATAAGCSPRVDDARARAVPSRRAAVPPRRVAVPPRHTAPQDRRTARRAARRRKTGLRAGARKRASPCPPARRVAVARAVAGSGRRRASGLAGRARGGCIDRQPRRRAPQRLETHLHYQQRRRRWPGLRGRHERCRQPVRPRRAGAREGASEARESSRARRTGPRWAVSQQRQSREECHRQRRALSQTAGSRAALCLRRQTHESRRHGQLAPIPAPRHSRVARHAQ